MSILSNANRSKILKISVRASLLILTAILIVLGIAHLLNSAPDFQTSLLILFFGCIVLPSAVLLGSVLIWVAAQKRKKMILDTLQLDKVGFVDKQIKQESFWELNETIKAKKIGNYTVNVNISDTHGDHLEVVLPLKWRHVNKSEFKILEDEWKSQNIELGIGCIVKRFKIKTLLRDYDVTKFDRDISDFVTLTNIKGFDPEF
jgi:hypothetical protein